MRQASIRAIRCGRAALASGLRVEGWRRNAPRMALCIQFSLTVSFFAERQCHRARRAVIYDLLHYAPNQAARVALLEALPSLSATRNSRRVSSLLNALRSWTRQILEHGSRDCLVAARIPSMLARLLAHIVSKRRPRLAV